MVSYIRERGSLRFVNPSRPCTFFKRRILIDQIIQVIIGPGVRVRFARAERSKGVSSHLTNSSPLTPMIDRVDNIIVYRVHAVSVIPFLFWLTGREVTQVSACIHLVMDLVVIASPVRCLHLIVRIECGRVKDIDVPCVGGCPRVSLPQVGMDSTWFYFASFSLKYSD